MATIFRDNCIWCLPRGRMATGKGRIELLLQESTRQFSTVPHIFLPAKAYPVQKTDKVTLREKYSDTNWIRKIPSPLFDLQSQHNHQLQIIGSHIQKCCSNILTIISMSHYAYTNTTYMSNINPVQSSTQLTSYHNRTSKKTRAKKFLI